MSLVRFKNSTFLPYYYRVYRNMKTFERMVNELVHAKTLSDRMQKALEAVEYAEYHPTGYYSSSELEGVFLEAANTIPTVECNPEKGTVLHVLTKAYTSGGHTRVVQRWMDLSKADEKHSVLLLHQEKEVIPIWLKETAEKHHGSLLIFDEPNILKRAAQLRQLASTYERIILHIHPNDPVALMAFGVESFTTSIILFNHADHLFWLGVSIADVVADMRYDNFSYIRRNVSQSYTLGIPCASMEWKKSVDKQALRRELGIPENDYVLVTTGSEFKYTSLGSNSICKQFVELSKKNNISCYAIGPSMKNKMWASAHEESNGKIHPLGVVDDKVLYRKYLQAADLYVCSYPYGGYTAMMDAVQCGLPFIQLVISRQQKSLIAIHPNINQAKCVCYTTKELLLRIYKVLHNKEEYNDILASSKTWASEYANQEEWQIRLYDMYNQSPQKHAIRRFECKHGKQVWIDDELCLSGMMYSKEDMEPKNKILRQLAHGWMRMKGV